MFLLRAAWLPAVTLGLVASCAAPRGRFDGRRTGADEAAPSLREATQETSNEPAPLLSHEAAEDWAPLLGRARRGTSYELDDRDRSPPPSGRKPTCNASEMVTYRGLVLRYDAPVAVHPAFAERLIRFERLVREVAIEVYGRAPRILHQGGAYMCRTTVTGRRWSEHAFGNALDVEGFTFDALDKASAEKLKARGVEIDASVRRSFRVHVGETWRRGRGRGIDKNFFALLLQKIRTHPDMFRGIIGPPDPAHTTHLHLDVGPWSYDRFVMP